LKNLHPTIFGFWASSTSCKIELCLHPITTWILFEPSL
jgi:hypothetical protein